ncbi:hypothetical protein A8E38_08960 [Burkholderia cenocepacia]|nr:hypothetical protein A8E38_08960 [Burkholderia cenocepacia]
MESGGAVRASVRGGRAARIGRTAFVRQSPPRDEWGRSGAASIAWVPMHDERHEEGTHEDRIDRRDA